MNYHDRVLQAYKRIHAVYLNTLNALLKSAVGVFQTVSLSFLSECARASHLYICKSRVFISDSIWNLFIHKIS
jgi:hypothetical protein